MPEEGFFLQNVIAIIWDFDKTLSPIFMQKPLFDAYDVDTDEFWKEVNALPDYYGKVGITIHEDTCYLGHLLSYVKHGPMKGLTNERLTELGKNIPLFPGLPEFFGQLKATVAAPQYQEGEITLEHYVVSTGLDAMIRGTDIAPEVDDIWASVFIEEPAIPGQDFSQSPKRSEISQIAGFLDNTTKTRAIFEINKGVNKTDKFSVNDTIEHDKRRVPFENMIYIADGPSDIPSFSIVTQNGGKAYAVYDPDAPDDYAQAAGLNDQHRVDHFGPADYRPNTGTSLWLEHTVKQMADRIMEKRNQRIDSSVASAPSH
ncbi:MAG: haloacid dehalogenase-like hydrolase [Candidatus Hydrogenedentota bacterium]